VTTLSFPSDISLGVAKAIFIILEQHGADFVPDDIAVLGDAYVAGTRRYEDDLSVQDRVKEIADNLYAGNDSPEWLVYNRCKEFNIHYFESITRRLGSQFDGYIYESQAGITGKEIVMNHTPDIFTKSEGAIVYIPDESKKNLHTAVFINSQSNPTYEAKDLGLLDIKFKTYNPEQSIFITDHEQVSHFQVVLDAAEKINPIWKNNSHHVAHGRMSFKGQKMSSRLGNTPLVSDMIDLVLNEVQERSQDRSIDSVTQESIAIGALKFAILKAKPGENINFDPEVNLSFEGDSGPYLQYTHARITSLLEKADNEGFTPQITSTEQVGEIERLVYRLPQVIARATAHYAPNYVVTYLLEVARAFNSFYGSHKIIDTENKQTTEHRLVLALAVKTVLKNGLYVLGIIAPEKM
jgi:arginyl-tRNA synthetase